MQIPDNLLTRPLRIRLDDYLAVTLQSLGFPQAEAVLAHFLAMYPSGYSGICQSVGVDDVCIDGWDQMHVDFIATEQTRGPIKGGCCTAVALNLVNRQSLGSIFLISKFYRETDYPPVAKSRVELLTELRNGPWLWRRNHSARGQLTINGLEGLAAAQRAYRFRDTEINEEIGWELAGWWILLRFHQAVCRGLAAHGMPRAIPVFAGVDRLDRPMEDMDLDYPPEFESVYLAEAHSVSGSVGGLCSPSPHGRDRSE